MWSKPRPRLFARMPSTRAQPLNPQAPEPPAGAGAPAASLLDALFGSAEGEVAPDRAARAGAFHESSYELREGLEINESDWPDDITIPAALGKD